MKKEWVNNVNELMEKWMDEHIDSIKSLRARLEDILDEYFDELYDYFRFVMEYDADYKVLIARRCMVLFQIFTQIFWADGIQAGKGVILSDWAIPKFGGKFAPKKIMVVDDILIHGTHIGKIWADLERYGVTDNVELCVYMATDDRKYLPDGIERKLRCAEKAVGSEWRELSNLIVKAIAASNIPYTSFVGSYTLERKNCFFLNNNTVEKIVNESRLQTEVGSSSFLLFERQPEPEIFHHFSYQSCIRVYQNQNSELLTWIPYCFTKAVKKDNINKFFHSFADKLTICPSIRRELLTDRGNSEWDIYRLNLFDAFLSHLYGLYFFREEEYIGFFDCDTMVKSFGEEIAAELVNMSYGQIEPLLKQTCRWEDNYFEECFEEHAELKESFSNISSDNIAQTMNCYLLQYRKLSTSMLEVGKYRPRGLSIDYMFQSASDFQRQLCAVVLNHMDTGRAAAVYGLSDDGEVYASFIPSGEVSYQIILEKYPEIIRQMILLEEENLDIDEYLTLLEKRDVVKPEEKTELSEFLEKYRGQLRKWNVVDILENRDLWKHRGVSAVYGEYCERQLQFY